MSQFSKKLAIAFNGATNNMKKRRNLITNGVCAGTATGICAAVGAVTGLALLPFAAAAAASYVAIDGGIGAYYALKADRKHNQPKQ